MPVMPTKAYHIFYDNRGLSHHIPGCFEVVEMPLHLGTDGVCVPENMREV